MKSPPELWSELSEVERLARHLDAFGEIKITKLEPEREVAWEAESASGTVSIEPSGWGTKVVMTASLATAPEPEAPPEPEPEPASEGVPAESQPTVDQLQEPPVPKRGWLARLFGWERGEAASEQPVWVVGAPVEAAEEPPTPEPASDAVLVAEEPSEPVAPEPAVAPGPAVAPEPEALAPTAADDGALTTASAQAALEDALEALGSAHHRPFSRG